MVPSRMSNVLALDTILAQLLQHHLLPGCSSWPHGAKACCLSARQASHAAAALPWSGLKWVLLQAPA